MSLPRISALTCGHLLERLDRRLDEERHEAELDAVLLLERAPGTRLRSAMTADMSISLNVVSSAAVCWACDQPLGDRAGGSGSSGRLPPRGRPAGCAREPAERGRRGAGGAGAALGAAAARCTSSFSSAAAGAGGRHLRGRQPGVARAPARRPASRGAAPAARRRRRRGAGARTRAGGAARGAAAATARLAAGAAPRSADAPRRPWPSRPSCFSSSRERAGDRRGQLDAWPCRSRSRPAVSSCANALALAA